MAAAEGVRTVGVEEELLVVDPGTRRVAPRAGQVLQRHAAEQHGEPAEALDRELFRHQLEIRTEPALGLDDVRQQLAAARRHAAGDADAVGLAVAASGTVLLAEDDEPRVSPVDRYLDMVGTYGEMVRVGTTCGMHVHVAIDSPDEGVACVDRIAPWLPVLLALSANSPFHLGRDTAHASWRAQLWSRWPTAGPREAFGSLEAYRAASAALVASGAARDTAMLYYDARLAERHPTVEIRVLDVCTDLDDTVLLTALARALVTTAADDWARGRPWPRWRSDVLRAATWRASRFGVSERLVHPGLGATAPAREVVDALVAHVRVALERAGDLDRVVADLPRLLAGTGATRQRAARERGGDLQHVVDDLVARTARA